jgi:Zn-dependent protease
MANPIDIVYYLLALVVSITIHEFAHAWSASELGDDTARSMGRLSLNPVVHFDPMGALMIVFMSLSGWGIGWGKPVPVNSRNLRTDPRVGMALTSVAGPFSNLVLAALAAIPLRLAWSLPQPILWFLYIFVSANLGLALFNLIPLPPLDGFHIIQGVLSAYRTRWAYDLSEKLDRVAAYSAFLLLGLLALGWFTPLDPLGWLLGPPLQILRELYLGW